MSFEYLMDELALHLGDRALRGAFAARYPHFRQLCADYLAGTAPKPTGLPHVADITAVQVGICDNWGCDQPVKNRPNRYGCVVEVWTKAASQIRTHKLNDYQHKLTGILMRAPELRAQIKRLSKNVGKGDFPLSREWLETLNEWVNTAQPDDHIALLASKSEGGTLYFDRQALWLSMSGGIVSQAALMVDGEPLHLPSFSPFQPDGQTRHKGNFILQSRADLCGFSTAWATP
jgi:hypothetical protein